MSSEKEYNRRYNPLELSVDEYGTYIQRLPECTFEALDAQFPKEYIVVKTLYHLVKRATNLTYLSGTDIIQEVETSTTKLADDINADQPNVYNALVKLQQQNWVQNTNKRKGAKGKYLVNFSKVIGAIKEYYELHKDNKPKKKRIKDEDKGNAAKELIESENWWETYSMVL